MARITYLGKTADCDFTGPNLEPGVAFELARGDVHTVGRGVDCDLLLFSNGVARKHALLFLPTNADRLHVIDLESTNGTWSRGERRPFHALNDGEELWIANAFGWRFSLLKGE